MYVSSDNYHSEEHPWHTDMDQYLSEIWNYEYNGNVYAVLYEINIK
ncbi:hypothetical protein ACFL20_05005 [Spirochaetota bacterium]